MQPVQTEVPPATRLPGANATAVSGLLLGLFAACYLFTALQVSATRPLWMDEVLAVWLSRLPAPGGIWDAVIRGGEFSPPTYSIGLHALAAVFGGGKLVLRLPSVLAAGLCAAATFRLLRGRLGFAFRALAAALTLELAIYAFAVQARPYLLVTACFAAALLGWDRAGHGRMPAWRPVTIAVALCLAVALHFYASLLVGTVILMEAARSLAGRRVRWTIWLALLAPVLSLAAWLPLMRTILGYNAGDTGAAHYIARPSLASLLSIYQDLLLGPNSALLLAFMLMLAAIPVTHHFTALRLREPPPERGRDLDLDILTAACLALPLLVFAAGVLATHTFNERYALGAAIGIAILYARLLSRLPGGAWMACGLLAASCGLWGIHALRGAAASDDPDLALLSQAPGDAPIVIGEGLHYLQLDEAADPALRRRLVFLRVPGAVSPDPTNEHQVERWAPIRPDLAILDLGTFVASHKAFYLFGDSDPKDVVTSHFIAAGSIRAVLGRDHADDGDSWLMRVEE